MQLYRHNLERVPYPFMIFSSFTVVELASVLAGPSVGQFFAELGARVIKIENKTTGGDVTRTWKSTSETTGDRSGYFCSVNWGKKSIALDLREPADRAVAYGLMRKADVVIASYKPGDAQKLGMDYETLRAVNPALVYGNVTGYGEDTDRVGYDAVVQAESGFMDLNGEKGGAPLKMPVALMDVLAAHQLKEGILLALLQRQATGSGAHVTVSLIQTALSSLVNQASNYLVGGHVPVRQGSQHPNIAPYGDVFTTQDHRPLLLAVGSDRQFFQLVKILGLTFTPEDHVLFGTNEKRVQNRTALAALLAPVIQHQPADLLLAKLHQQKIPAGIIQTVPQALALHEAQALFLQSDSFTGLRGFVAEVSGIGRAPLSPPPRLGEHTEEIKREVLG